MSCRRAGCACSLQAREARRSTRSRGSATSRQRPRSACGSHPSRVTLATRLVTLPKIGPDGGDRCRLDRSVRRWFTTAVRRSVRVRRRSRPQPQETRACTCSGCGPPSRTLARYPAAGSDVNLRPGTFWRRDSGPPNETGASDHRLGGAACLFLFGELYPRCRRCRQRKIEPHAAWNGRLGMVARRRGLSEKRVVTMLRLSFWDATQHRRQ